MNEKTFQSRFINKHDIEDAWRLVSEFIPRKGEIIIYDRDGKYNYERFKIGDGITKIKDLPFATEAALQKSVTYKELKALRDNAELIPGAFYRITDYVCTTVQENTRAMDNQFDIIVQALSSNTLSEIAKADYHIEKIESPEEAPTEPPTLNSSVVIPALESIVTPYYYEYVDCDFGPGPGLVEYNHDDIFISYDYLENGEGNIVPVIYKTHIKGFDFGHEEGYSPEYAEPDTEIPFFYVGRVEVDGEEYDKWKKIDIEGDGDPLTWETEAQVYLYTNILVEDNQIIYDSLLIDSSDPDKLPHIVSGAIEVYYREFVDYISNAYHGGLFDGDGTEFVTYNYREYNGSTVPVLYELDPDAEQVDFDEPFYYVGTVVIDGVSYDKWRNVENDDDQLTLNSKAKLYYYTNTVVDNGYPAKEESGNSGALASANIPAWEIKYCLDNDTTRFAWADEANGKGVIWYMKDEHNNECPYDFKNIQFKRYMITETEVDSISRLVGHYFGIPEGNKYNIDESDYIWCYTFSWLNENDEIEDLSVVGQYLPNDEGQYPGIYNNVINTISAYKGTWPDSPEHYCIDLNNIVYLSEWSYDDGRFCGRYSNTFGNDCNSNTFGNNCCSNTFGDCCSFNTFGDDCDFNIFGNDCNSNTFGCGCVSNTFVYGCGANIFGNNCHRNIFGNGCCRNIFGEGCGTNTFGDNCGSNTFDNGCHRNIFGKECYLNTFSNNCYHNTFGDNCDFNIFGNSCRSNAFGDECHDNCFGDDCCFNTFGNICNSNTFGNTCYSNTFGDECLSSTFGDECRSNTFGNESGANIFGNDCEYNHFGNSVSHNTFGNGCRSNAFGDECHDNCFGDDCDFNTFVNICGDNVFGDKCHYNTFGSDCDANTFGSECDANTFGDDCNRNTFDNKVSNNTFGYNCSANIFGYSCSSNTFGNRCSDNNFGNNCYYNTFGIFCENNTFGNFCKHNTFGDDCYNILFGTSETGDVSYVRYIRFENGCGNIKLLNSETGSTSNYIQDITVSAGLRGTSSADLELQVSRNAAPVIYEAPGTTHIILD